MVGTVGDMEAIQVLIKLHHETEGLDLKSHYFEDVCSAKTAKNYDISSTHICSTDGGPRPLDLEAAAAATVQQSVCVCPLFKLPRPRYI